MEPEDPDSFSSNMNPIDAIARLDRKRRVGESEKQERTPLDIAAMRMNAWNKQRQAQKERSRRGGSLASVLEDMTAAADMELAAIGFPFSLNSILPAAVLIGFCFTNQGRTRAKSPRNRTALCSQTSRGKRSAANLKIF